MKEKIIEVYEKLKSLYCKYKEIINYLIFGGLTTIVNFTTYYIPARVIGVDEVVSSGIAWVCSVIFAYLTNKIFVFGTKFDGIKTVVRELISFVGFRFISGMLCDIVMFSILFRVVGINDIVSKIITQVTVVIVNYVFSKIFIFKKEAVKVDQIKI